MMPLRQKGVEVQTRPCSCKMKHWKLEKVAPENRNCLEEEDRPRRAHVTESHGKSFAAEAAVGR